MSLSYLAPGHLLLFRHVYIVYMWSLALIGMTVVSREEYYDHKLSSTLHGLVARSRLISAPPELSLVCYFQESV